MIWFKYLKSGQSTSIAAENTNYSYPQVKRAIERFSPDVDIPKDFWLSIDVSSLAIDSYINSSLESSIDATSYLVVYESILRNNDFTPVQTKIKDGILYFKAAENHEANVFIPKQYALYYKTPNLQNVTPVTNGSLTSYKVSDSSNPYNPGELTGDLSLYSVSLGDINYYNFSFVNSGLDWENGRSIENNAKVYINFLGPTFNLYGDKGVDYGKLSYRIKPAEQLPDDVISNDFTVVDCYEATNSFDQNLISVSSLDKREYVMEIVATGEKNILAQNSYIKLSKFDFVFDLDLQLSNESLSTNINFVSLTPTSSQGSVGGDPVYDNSGGSSGTITDTNVRDVRILHIMEVM